MSLHQSNSPRRFVRSRRRATTAETTSAVPSNVPPNLDFEAHIVHAAIGDLRPPEAKLLKNQAQVAEGALRIASRCGALVPILARKDGEVVAGEEWRQAYLELGLEHVPVIYVEHLSDLEARTLRFSLIGLGQRAIFNEVVLASEISDILAKQPDLIPMMPWTMPEMDQKLAGALLLANEADRADVLPQIESKCVSLAGDEFAFADGSKIRHGDSRNAEHMAKLLDGQQADFVCTDQPYGIKVADISRRHGEFVAGSGCNEDEMRAFFLQFLIAMRPHLRDGCMVDTFMDYRGMYPLLGALREAGFEQKSHCIWDKENAGMGAPFRHVAEHVIVSKYGTAPHIDNVQLGKYGRNRTTIWRAPGYAGFSRDRAEALDRHPTCKPVGLIAEAILDFSHVGHLVLDPFIGSGTTLLAAHRTKRICYGMELDGTFVDLAVRRMQTFTGEAARHRESGLTFDELAERRANTGRPRKRVRTRPPLTGELATPSPMAAPASSLSSGGDGK